MPWRCLIVYIEDSPTNSPPNATPDTHSPAKERRYRETSVGKKKKNKHKGKKRIVAFQINNCGRKRFYFEHNKHPCHLETSQIASHRFVAPKNTQNAHGGAYDCRPSLKIQSCLCRAMKNHSALFLSLLQVLVCALSTVPPECRRNTADNRHHKYSFPTETIWPPFLSRTFIEGTSK